MDPVRVIATCMAASLAMCMLALFARYRAVHDWRSSLPLGYAASLAYIVAEQVSKRDQQPTWRTYIAICASALGWWAVVRIWRAAFAS
jgi:hypothetical protein